MEGEDKIRLQEMEKSLGHRFADIKSSIENVRSIVGNVLGMAGAYIVALTLVAGFLNYSDRRNMSDFQNEVRADIKERLGKGDDPQLDLQVVGQSISLVGQELGSTVFRNPPEPPDWRVEKELPYAPWRTVFHVALRNTSLYGSGPVVVKLYYNEAFRDALQVPSADEDGYKFETIVSERDFGLPGMSKFSIPVAMYSLDQPKPGRQQVLLKAYYGRGNTAQATFAVLIPSRFIDFAPQSSQNPINNGQPPNPNRR